MLFTRLLHYFHTYICSAVLQVSSQDPGCAPLHLSARCQCSGSLTRVSLDYHCCPASPATELSNVQVVISLEDSATDVHCQPPGVW